MKKLVSHFGLRFGVVFIVFIASSNAVASPAVASAMVGPGALSRVAEKAVQSVVHVAVEARASGMPSAWATPWGSLRRGRARRGVGSGVIVADDGVILTNHHVVRDATRIEVTLHDGRRVPARLVGADPSSDLAVIRLDGQIKGLQPLQFAQSDSIRLGQVVLAIGSPFGLQQTVTSGIVSAKGRANVGIVDYEDFIQTDAAINPGNSGGALVDLEGRLVGINTAIASRSGGSQGIGFAIPAKMAARVMRDLLAHGKVNRGWLGIMIQPLTPTLARAFEVPVTRGIVVADVRQGSAAHKADVRPRDVIVTIDGVDVKTPADLRNLIAGKGGGAKVQLSLWRGAHKRDVTVTLGQAPSRAVKSAAPTTAKGRYRWGVSVAQRGHNAVVVAGVIPGSPAAKAGLLRGDDILSAQGRPVRHVDGFIKTARDLPKGDDLVLRVKRRGVTLFVVLTQL